MKKSSMKQKHNAIESLPISQTSRSNTFSKKETSKRVAILSSNDSHIVHSARGNTQYEKLMKNNLQVSKFNHNGSETYFNPNNTLHRNKKYIAKGEFSPGKEALRSVSPEDDGTKKLKSRFYKESVINLYPLGLVPNPLHSKSNSDRTGRLIGLLPKEPPMESSQTEQIIKISSNMQSLIKSNLIPLLGTTVPEPTGHIAEDEKEHLDNVLKANKTTNQIENIETETLALLTKFCASNENEDNFKILFQLGNEEFSENVIRKLSEDSCQNHSIKQNSEFRIEQYENLVNICLSHLKEINEKFEEINKISKEVSFFEKKSNTDTPVPEQVLENTKVANDSQYNFSLNLSLNFPHCEEEIEFTSDDSSEDEEEEEKEEKLEVKSNDQKDSSGLIEYNNSNSHIAIPESKIKLDNKQKKKKKKKKKK